MILTWYISPNILNINVLTVGFKIKIYKANLFIFITMQHDQLILIFTISCGLLLFEGRNKQAHV